MKKLFKALVMSGLLFSFGTSAFAAIPGDPTKPGIILRVKGASQDAAIPVYRLVRFSNRNPNQQQISQDCAVVWDNISGDGITVRLTTTSNDPAFAGICVSNIPTADNASTQASDDDGRRNWGYICVGGFTTAQAKAGGLNGTPGSGLPFGTSVDVGCITNVNTPATAADALLLAQAKGGILLQSGDGTTTSYKVFVQAQ